MVDAAAGGPEPAGGGAPQQSGLHTIFAFISSSLGELKAERDALHILRGGIIEPYFYDEERGATTGSHQEAWRHDLAKCKLYIGIYWKKLGEWTLDEYEFAKDRPMPMLLYFKGSYDEADRSPELLEFIRARGDVDLQGDKYFAESPDEFAQRVAADLKMKVSEIVAASLEPVKTVQADEQTYRETPVGGRVDDAAGPPPAVVRRSDVGTLKPFRGDFIPREDLIAEFIDLLEDEGEEELIALVGPSEAGKESLLQWLFSEEFEDFEHLKERFPDGLGVNPRGAREDGFDDLLRTVFEMFYKSEDPTVVGQWDNADLQEYLDGRGANADGEPIQALLVFSDVPADGPFAELRKALPSSLAVCTTSEDEPDDSVVVPVEGFEPDETEGVLDLFASRYKAPVPEKAAENVLLICSRLDNLPGAIKELARLASTEAKPVAGIEPLVAWARAKAEGPPEELLKRGGAAKEAVKALVAAGGEAPAEVIGAVAGPGNAGEALAEAVIEQGSPRYRLAGVVTADEADAAADDRLMGAILESAVAWAAEAWRDDIREDRAFVIRMVEWGASHGRHAEAIKLARAADSALAMGVRWGAWERLLEGALGAAVASGDKSAEAWARHQLGTRALMVGNSAVAIAQLESALELRRGLGEREGADVTLHNLRRLKPPPRRPWKYVAPALALIGLIIVLALCSTRATPPFAGFTLPFGAVQVPNDTPLFLPGPDAYDNPGTEPRVITITMAGDPEFCFAIVGENDGVCVLPPDDEATGLERAPPLGPLIGVPLAQAGAAEDCAVSVDGDEARLTIAAGADCQVLFGFEPPRDPNRGFGATATFRADGGTWEGMLTGSTFDPANPVLAVTMAVDADGDGVFGQVDQAPAGDSVARFEVSVENLAGKPLELIDLIDNHYGDIGALANSTCARIATFRLPADRTFKCRYDGPVSGTPGSSITNIFTVSVELDGERVADSASARIEFTDEAIDPRRDVVVTKTVDADGDGIFGKSEPFPAPLPGPVTYQVSIRNLGDEAVEVVQMTDSAFGDVSQIPGTGCRTGEVIEPTGIVECDFTAQVDPGGGAPHRNTVSVVTDPALGSPYTSDAEVTFQLDPDTLVTVTKSVDANLDGDFGPVEALILPIETRDRPFQVVVSNMRPESILLVRLVDDVFGDVMAIPGTTCEAGRTIASGESYECEFTATIEEFTATAADSPGTTHIDTVTATVGTDTGLRNATSNPVNVIELGTSEAIASLGVVERIEEGAPREVDYEIRVEQGVGGATRLDRYLVAPFGDVAADGNCIPGFVLEAGARFTCTFTRLVGGNAGETFSAVLDAEALNATPVGTTATVEFTNVAPALAVEVDGPPSAAPGERVEITVEIRNASVAATDPVTLTSLVASSGPLVGADDSDCVLTTIPAGGSTSCSFDLVVAGSAGDPQSVTVTASGVDDEGTSVEAIGGHTLTVGAPPIAGIEIFKGRPDNADEDGSATVSAGDTLTYRIFVLNIGQEQLTSVVVDDPLTGFRGTCGGRSVLAPGATTSCTASHRVTAAEAGAGRVVNRVNVAAVAPSGPVADFDTRTVTVPVLTLTVTQEGNDDPDGSQSVTEGDRLTIRYLVAARADFGSVRVTDSLPGVTPLDCRPVNQGELVRGGTMECEARYLVSSADADAGSVTFTGRAVGITRDDQTVIATETLQVDVVSTSLAVRILTDPPSGVEFDLSGALNGTLRHGEVAIRRVLPGTYDVAVSYVPEVWALQSVSCDDANSTEAAGTATFRLAENERVTCTFRFRGLGVLEADFELIDFGTVGSPVERAVTLRNVGTRSLTLDSATVEPPGSDFSVITTACGGVLSPGSSCVLRVGFSPTTPGVHAGFITLVATATDGSEVTGDFRLLMRGVGL